MGSGYKKECGLGISLCTWNYK